MDSARYRLHQMSISETQMDIRAVSRVLVLSAEGRVVGCGSGVCIDPEEGLLLTATHVVCSQKYDARDSSLYQILLAPQTHDLHTVPAWRYRCLVVASSEPAQVDMAILKVQGCVLTEPSAGLCPADQGLATSMFRAFGVQDLPGDLSALHGAKLGQGSRLELGQDLVMYGWSANGGDLITRADCRVGGFTVDRHTNQVSAIKATFSAQNGMSGGPVFDGTGCLVAVLSCSKGSIDFLRPVELCYGLVEEARVSKCVRGAQAER
eukprot:TRINITY_DN8323_c0_g1_i1.p1 TRINITY_DN8323_c0_g1~~TRINITY_DN8323_c0_g1_i1.p1  ORF type:complete len:264 (+),score=40.04 TRINITY_DN8323_c0_g1_i1:149-940(+)